MKVCELIGWLRTLDPQGEIKVDYDGMYHDPTISKASKDWDERVIIYLDSYGIYGI